MFEINILAVIAAAGVAMGVGALWYSPLLFAEAWMKAVGKSPEELPNPGGAMGYAALTTIGTAFAMALLIGWTGAGTLAESLLVAIVVWAGFSLTSHSMLLIFEGRPWRLFLINVSHQLAAYLAMGLVLSLWA